MREIEFRDGRREVQDHVADFLEGKDTYRFTHQEAMRQMNENLLKQRLSKAQDDIVRQHFARYPKQ